MKTWHKTDPVYISQVGNLKNQTSLNDILLNMVCFDFKENFLNSPKSKFIHTEEKLSRFLSKKRPIIERALAQNAKNIFFDYSAALNEK